MCSSFVSGVPIFIDMNAPSRRGRKRRSWRRQVVAWLEDRSQREIWLLALGCVTLFGAGDYAIRRQLELSVLYVLPVGLITYYIGRRDGALVSFLAAVVWTWAKDSAGDLRLPTAVMVFNSMARLATFLVVVVLVDALRAAFEGERELALTDGLTGAANQRAFLERAEQELARSKRYRRPLTLIHFDLDGFKGVNDRLGHEAGDEVLVAVVEQAGRVLRRSDIVARLGGDEFALLLPETDQAGAKVVAEKLRSALEESLLARGWPVTGSFGILTCLGVADSLTVVMHQADQLMYQSKSAGKNRLSFQVIGP
jgi:diguanylate cyclase (GGDEF)-like protein